MKQRKLHEEYEENLGIEFRNERIKTDIGIKSLKIPLK